MSAVTAIERPNIWLPPRRRHLHLVPTMPVAPLIEASAISFVNNVGSNVSTSAGSSTLTLVPAQNLVGGNFVALAANMGGTATLSSVSDTKSNTWTVDKVQGSSGGPAGLATTWMDKGTLLTTDTITLTGSGTGANKVCAAMQFTNISHMIGRLDQVIGGTGTTATAATSGATPTTLYDEELVLGAISWAGASQLTLTKGASYTASLEKDEASGAFLGIALEYKIATAKAAMTADGTISAAPTSWNAICATYKLQPGLSRVSNVAQVVQAAAR